MRRKVQLHKSVDGSYLVLNAKAQAYCVGTEEECLKYLAEENYKYLGEIVGTRMYVDKDEQNTQFKKNYHYANACAAHLILQQLRSQLSDIRVQLIQWTCAVESTEVGVEKIKESYIKMCKRQERRLMKYIAHYVNNVF